MSTSITIKLQGGLGNQLFQLSAFDYITKALHVKNRKYIRAHGNLHSHQDYFNSQSIFSNLELQKVDEEEEEEQNQNALLVNENEIESLISYVDRDWSFLDKRLKENDVVMFGYFQHWKYVKNSFLQKLVLPCTQILKGAFLHIRGGDYVNHYIHHIDLHTYYTKSMQLFPSETHFYIFTNDCEYSKTFNFNNATLVEETNEVICLALMSRCTSGGICANSTFSWWAGILNDGLIVIPDTWSKDKDFVVDRGFFHPRFVPCSTK